MSTLANFAVSFVDFFVPVPVVVIPVAVAFVVVTFVFLPALNPIAVAFVAVTFVFLPALNPVDAVLVAEPFVYVHVPNQVGVVPFAVKYVPVLVAVLISIALFSTDQVHLVCFSLFFSFLNVTCQVFVLMIVLDNISFYPKYLLTKVISGSFPTTPIIITGAAVALLGVWIFELFPGRSNIDQAASFPGFGIDRAKFNAGDLAASYQHITPDGVDVIANLQAGWFPGHVKFSKLFCDFLGIFFTFGCWNT